MANRTTSADVVEQLAALLFADGARQVPSSHYVAWPVGAVAFEDAFSLIALWSFDTVDDLRNDWLQAQELVVRLLGTTLANTDPKAWDGYLVLATADIPNTEDLAPLTAIKADTRRVRKLIITGDDVPGMSHDRSEFALAARRTLAPVLRLTLPKGLAAPDPLTALPTRLDLSSSDSEILSTALEAQAGDAPLLEAIFERRRASESKEQPQ